MKSSEKPSSADYQQERSKLYQRGYIAGLVDGEGSFHVAFAKRYDLPLKVYPIPEFHISQHGDSINVLKLAQKIFDCGYIKENHKRSKDSTYVYVVKNKRDLVMKIIPFFKYYPLYTKKKDDFEKFAVITQMIVGGYHQNKKGMVDIINLAYKMNNSGARRVVKKEELITILKSSETIRECPEKSG